MKPEGQHRNGASASAVAGDSSPEFGRMALGATVLFAEDETTIRNAVAQLLSSRGFRVLVADDGYEALRLLLQEDVDVLFTDIVMPGLGGVELAQRARRIRPEIQVMFVTGYAAKASEAMHLGKLLYKPVRVHDIDTELRNLLAAAKPGAAME